MVVAAGCRLAKALVNADVVTWHLLSSVARMTDAFNYSRAQNSMTDKVFPAIYDAFLAVIADGVANELARMLCQSAFFRLLADATMHATGALVLPSHTVPSAGEFAVWLANVARDSQGLPANWTDKFFVPTRCLFRPSASVPMLSTSTMSAPTMGAIAH